MTNAFNSVSKRVIFQELHVVNGDIIQLIPFVCAFYAFEFPLFYNHHNRESDVMVIPSTTGTHQSDPLGRALFALIHFEALCSITNHFPFCLSPSIGNDTHIINLPSIVSPAYEQFRIEFYVINLFIQLQKCVTWSPLPYHLTLTSHPNLTPHLSLTSH